MISGGNATLFISNMDQSVQFYTQVLGLKLTNRFGDHWATVDAGKGLTIGLHPASPKFPAPGTKGAMMLSLEITEPIDRVVAQLAEKGVRLKGSIISKTRMEMRFACGKWILARFLNLKSPRWTHQRSVVDIGGISNITSRPRQNFSNSAN